jgi:Mor family transcriptional regulator
MNAKDVLPETLIVQIQKYIKGSVIYIPQSDNIKESRTTKTDAKNELAERNNEIRCKKKSGVSIDELMQEYHLSYDTIKSIVYRK